MEGRAKVTKEVLCEEARFILANVMAEARYGRQNRYDDIRRVCEGAVSIPFSESSKSSRARGFTRWRMAVLQTLDAYDLKIYHTRHSHCTSLFHERSHPRFA